MMPVPTTNPTTTHAPQMIAAEYPRSYTPPRGWQWDGVHLCFRGRGLDYLIKPIGYSWLAVSLSAGRRYSSTTRNNLSQAMSWCDFTERAWCAMRNEQPVHVFPPRPIDPTRTCIECGESLCPMDLEEEWDLDDPDDYRYHVRCPNRVCGARYVVGADELAAYHAEIGEDA